MEGERERQKQSGWRLDRKKEKKPSQKHIRAKRSVVFKGLQFSSSLCNVTGAAL